MASESPVQPDIARPDTNRVLERLDRIYEIGGGEGANRPALSGAEQRAHDLVAAWMDEAGLEVSRDPAGNLFGRLRGRNAEAAEVWTGSHLDSVPDGGRFDGTLGVVAGVEAVERIAADGPPERTLAVVAFRDEEGWRFGRGFFGSRALCGRLDDDELDAADRDGITVRDALDALGLPAPPREGWLHSPPRAFVEAHDEQGPRLAQAGAPLGLVSAIVGIARGTAVFTGRADHAGTTPMSDREDALCAAAEFVLRLRSAAAAVDGAVATVGQITVEPGAANVVPGQAALTVDVRAPDRARLDAVLAAIPEARVRTSDPVAMADEPRRALREAIERVGCPVVELASGAGHDAGILAAVGVPTAMLFVRSLAGGASHSPNEATSEGDVDLCVDALAGAMGRLSRS